MTYLKDVLVILIAMQCKILMSRLKTDIFFFHFEYYD